MLNSTLDRRRQRIPLAAIGGAAIGGMDERARRATFGAVGGDLLVGAILVTACFALFYRAWPLWEDQGIYHYMAWGLGHGMKPYGDTINMNWPGIVVVHWLAHLISGSQPLGLRLLDSLALLLLLLNTSILLVQAGVTRPWRLLGFVAYLASYYATGFAQTAQRESFCLPLVSCGLVACLTAIHGRGPGRTLTFVAGLLAGLGLAIKPTLGLPLAIGVLLVIVSRGNLRQRCRFTLFFLLGALVAALLALAFLAWCCDWDGFLEWGIRYAFGPYRQTQWPAWQRVRNTARLFVTFPGPVLLLAMGVAAWAAARFRVGWHALRYSEGRGSDASRPFPMLPLLVLLAATYLSIFVQGKTHCRYHFHPLQWLLAVAGVCLFARFVPAKVLAWRWPMFLMAAALAVHAGIVAAHKPAEPTPGTVLARQLKATMTPADEVVLFGFSPTLLAELECRTPFPFVDSWIIYGSAAGNPQYEGRIARALREALERPEVRYFVVEHRSPIVGLPGFERSPQDIARDLVPAEQRTTLGFTRIAVPGCDPASFDVFERRPSQRPKS